MVSCVARESLSPRTRPQPRLADETSEVCMAGLTQRTFRANVDNMYVILATKLDADMYERLPLFTSSKLVALEVACNMRFEQCNMP